MCVLTENLRGSSQTLMADNFIHLGVSWFDFGNGLMQQEDALSGCYGVTLTWENFLLSRKTFPNIMFVFLQYSIILTSLCSFALLVLFSFSFCIDSKRQEMVDTKKKEMKKLSHFQGHNYLKELIQDSNIQYCNLWEINAILGHCSLSLSLPFACLNICTI